MSQQSQVPVQHGIPATGDNAIDSLIQGSKWGFGLGSVTTLTYSFPQCTAFFPKATAPMTRASGRRAGTP